jgi:endo-1,4-beta-xylanase
MLFGTCASRAELGRPQFTEVLGREAGVVVCENDMKWANIHPGVNQYDFTGGDLLMNFAAEHGQIMRGHNLCWHQQLPKWFEPATTPNNVEELLRLHIATVAGHYKGRLHSWDVVNEAIQIKDSMDQGFRNSAWFKLAGRRYIEVAFRAAAEADAHAVLTYNDYDIEQDGPEYDAKRAAVLGLLRWLRDRNAPIQALGLQSHLKTRATPDRWDGLHAFIGEVEELGVTTFVTELDVDDGALTGRYRPG